MQGATAVSAVPAVPRNYIAGTDNYVDAAAMRARKNPNLVDCFIAAMAAEGWAVSHIAVTEKTRQERAGRGNPIRVGYLNEKLGMDIGYPRLREWATGARQVPDKAAALMAEKAVPWILREVGFEGGELPENVLRGLVARAFPWAAAANQSEKPVATISTEAERWMTLALMPPLHKEKSEVKLRRPVKKAPRKIKAAKAVRSSGKATAVAKVAKVAKAPPAGKKAVRKAV